MKLSEINIYPIKSLGGISLNEARIEERGLENDRRMMLVNEKNVFLSQREFPQMATVAVDFAENGWRVSHTDETLFVPFLPNSNETAKVTIWQSKCAAIVYESVVNEWFTDILKVKCRLVLMPETTRRRVNPRYAVRKFADTVSFADGYPILLISEGSLADLNARLEKPVPMNRFRPNLVVTGAESFAEDSWKKIRIGKSIFHLVKPCARCVMTTIDQTKGVSDGKEPLKTLATFRLKKSVTGQKILFGQNLIAESFGGTIKIGDCVEISEMKKRKLKF